MKPARLPCRRLVPSQHVTVDRKKEAVPERASRTHRKIARKYIVVANSRKTLVLFTRYDRRLSNRLSSL